MNLSFLLAYFLTLDSMQWLQIISFIVGRCLLKTVSFSSLSMFKIAALTCLTNRGHIWASFPHLLMFGAYFLVSFPIPFFVFLKVFCYLLLIMCIHLCGLWYLYTSAVACRIQKRASVPWNWSYRLGAEVGPPEEQ